MADTESLLKELLDTFRAEAQDHLAALSALLIQLEGEPAEADRRRLVEGVFRRMHTLKGAAHAVNLVEVAKGCQDLEDLLAEVKRGERELEQPLFDRLHAEIDRLSGEIFGGGRPPHPHPVPPPAFAEASSFAKALADTSARRLEGEGALQPAASRKEASPPVPAGEERGGGASPAAQGSPDRQTTASRRQDEVSAGRKSEPSARRQDEVSAGRKSERGARLNEPAPAAPAAAIAPEPPPTSNHHHATAETVRVPTRLLQTLLLQAEELASAKLAASALVEETAAVAGELARREAERYRALDLAREALRLAEPESTDAHLAALVADACRHERQLEGRLRALEKGAEKHLWALSGLVDPLLDDLKKLHLLPFSALTAPLAKLVRDLSRELGKQAEFTCHGIDIEADRRILAGLKEPLLHIVRNMMDHGIEPAAERALAGKPPAGRIELAVCLKDANRAELTVTDDGRGIDPAQVKGAAVRLELLTAEAAERLSDSEALQLAFESGVSTSQIITTLSGRGVGLAIVRESLEKLGGHATVASTPGAGTEFTLSFPLSFAMIGGLLVETAGRACVLPAGNVEATARVPADEVKSVENRDTVVMNGEVVSLVSLARLLELGEPADEETRQLVLLSAAGRRIAFAVDEVVGVQEVLVKPLGSQLARVRNVAGATVLGNGKVVPVLNVGDLFRSALLTGAGAAARPAAARARRPSVLVAEDSITSRTLLKNILEAAGFLVATAVDGADALAQLKGESFDIVVSDVEMPRMDGFELTAAIRKEARFEALPVVLVTGLESRADRERGVAVGANAYLVKSSFDQGNLIEVIERLI